MREREKKKEKKPHALTTMKYEKTSTAVALLQQKEKQ